MSGPARLILVDGSSLIYRAFFAIPSNFSTSAGLPTNAIYGFANMFRKILGGKTPEYGAVVFDAPGPTFRAQRYPEYKSHRPRMDPRLREQLAHIDALVDAHAFPRLRVPGYEADDIIGTLIRRAQREGLEVQIISGDKDFAQLIGDDVRMIDTLRDVTYDAELVRKKWGVPPPHFVDYLALVGDSSDNIPGVSGIGSKGAAALLEKYGSLDGIFAAVEKGEIGGAQGQRLRDGRAQAYLSQELARIEDQVPLEDTAAGAEGLEGLALHLPSGERLNELYGEFEFYSLLEGGDEDIEAGFDDAADYRGIEDLDELIEFVDDLRRCELAVVLPFLDHDSAAYGPFTGLAFSLGHGHGRYLSVDGVEGMGDEALAWLRPWFEDERAGKITYDGKRLWMALQRRERPIELRGVESDVQLESFLVDPTKNIPHELPELVKAWLHRTIPARKRVTGAGKAEELLSEIEPREIAGWAAQRADMVARMAPPLRDALEQVDLLGQLRDQDIPLGRVLGRMELAGILVDPDDLDAMGLEFRERLTVYESEIYALAGREFNIRSTKQLGEVLFDEMGLPVIKRTKTGYSTNAEVLERLVPHHEIARPLLDHRKLTKLINTYTDVLSEAVRPETGRIHCIFQQTVGATGRLISTDPDLQRTPVKTSEGARIRQTFIAPPGQRLIAADWSQIELRLLAHVTGDPRLVAAFQSGSDVHRQTAAELFAVEPADVDKQQRDVGKLVNFATIYGQGATALGQILGIKRARAQAYIDGYFAVYGGVRRWLDETIAEAHARGFVETLSGRRRYIPELSSNAFMERQAGERIAANTPIQGSAADLCKLAMLDIDRRLRDAGSGARMLLQIHDELVFECPEAELDRVCRWVREAMEGAAELAVPLVVDVGVGRTWGEAKVSPWDFSTSAPI